MKLSESQLQTILHALRVAAERFDVDTACMRDLAREQRNEAFSSLALQFERQARESREIADLCEECELSFSTPPAMPCGCNGETFTCSAHAVNARIHYAANYCKEDGCLSRATIDSEYCSTHTTLRAIAAFKAEGGKL